MLPIAMPAITNRLMRSHQYISPSVRDIPATLIPIPISSPDQLPCRHKYVEEKMAERRKLNSEFTGDGQATGTTKISKEEADEKLLTELYRLPDNLRVSRPTP